MDEENKPQSEGKPMLTVSRYINGEHIIEAIAYSDLTIEQLVDLTLSGSSEANKELQRRVGVNILTEDGI
jgi:hypothetical protein